MITQVCKCGKKIQGYNKNQVDHMMKQHLLSKTHNLTVGEAWKIAEGKSK